MVLAPAAQPDRCQGRPSAVFLCPSELEMLQEERDVYGLDADFWSWLFCPRLEDFGSGVDLSRGRWRSAWQAPVTKNAAC